MRRDVLGILLMLLGAGYLVGAALNVVGNTALGNPIEGAFLFELLAYGLVGVAVLVAGIALVVQSIRHPVVRQPAGLGPRAGRPVGAHGGAGEWNRTCRSDEWPW